MDRLTRKNIDVSVGTKPAKADKKSHLAEQMLSSDSLNDEENQVSTASGPADMGAPASQARSKQDVVVPMDILNRSTSSESHSEEDSTHSSAAHIEENPIFGAQQDNTTSVGDEGDESSSDADGGPGPAVSPAVSHAAAHSTDPACSPQAKKIAKAAAMVTGGLLVAGGVAYGLTEGIYAAQGKDPIAPQPAAPGLQKILSDALMECVGLVTGVYEQHQLPLYANELVADFAGRGARNFGNLADRNGFEKQLVCPQVNFTEPATELGFIEAVRAIAGSFEHQLYQIAHAKVPAAVGAALRPDAFNLACLVAFYALLHLQSLGMI